MRQVNLAEARAKNQGQNLSGYDGTPPPYMREFEIAAQAIAAYKEQQCQESAAKKMKQKKLEKYERHYLPSGRPAGDVTHKEKQPESRASSLAAAGSKVRASAAAVAASEESDTENWEEREREEIERADFAEDDEDEEDEEATPKPKRGKAKCPRSSPPGEEEEISSLIKELASAQKKRALDRNQQADAQAEATRIQQEQNQSLIALMQQTQQTQHRLLEAFIMQQRGGAPPN